MHSLEKRVATLEATVKLSGDITIVKRFVSVGAVDCELQSLHDDDGNQWTRQTGETEKVLIARASREVKRNQWGVASLTGGD